MRITEDSFVSLVRAWQQSAKWTLPPPAGYSDATKDLWGRELKFMTRPDTLGAVSLETIRPALVQAYLDGLAGRPGKQAVARSVFVQLERWAIVRDLLPRPITTGVETEKPQGGHVPWTDAEVELGELHARADFSRVITLAANTGQRGSDLIRMCPTDIETYKGIEGINVTQKKTGKQVWIPITSALAAAMTKWERRPGPFLTRLDGSAWTRADLTHRWTAEKERNALLAPIKDRGLVLHGLRGTACVRLRRAGATIPQIADMVGMSEPMVARYCRFSLQKENAIAAVIHLDRTISERVREISSKSGV